MAFQAGQVLTLSDSQGHALGTVTIERIEPEWISGPFVPGPDYPVVEPLFQRFQELADDFVLSLIDEAEDAILALGLQLRYSADGWPIEPATVQIWDSNVLAFKEGPRRGPTQNGAAAEARPDQVNR